MTESAPAIEGITPNALWIFFSVLFALIALFVLVAKAVDIIRNWQKERRQHRELGNQDITDRISDKVMTKLEPKLDEKLDEKFAEIKAKFDEIDGRLQSDKETLDLHTRQLNATDARVDRLDNDTKALLHGMSALLSHEVNGNSIDKLTKAQTATNNYLIDRVYREEAWT